MLKLNQSIMSPRSPAKFEEIREEKKALIMNTAMELFSNVGFHATTITLIAKSAGISKGLLYNYFRSKEELLAGIVNRSLSEIYSHFDPDHDGYLTVDEFEMFIRKVFNLIREKRQFWRLLYGIMLQRGVYEKIFNSEFGPIHVDSVPLQEFSQNLIRQFTEYFNRKKKDRPADYDPYIEMVMFMNTIKGFAITYLFSDDLYQDDYFERATEALIRTYK